MDLLVSSVTGEAFYNEEAPFHPACSWPELRFPERSGAPNPAYDLLRRALIDLGLDRSRLGAADWNPLGSVIRPGDTVVIKPNFVVGRNAGSGPLAAVVTHPSVLRAVLDYAFIALNGKGRLIIADTPQMDCQWDELMAFERLSSVQEFYARRFQFRVEVLDLRSFCVADPAQPAYAGNRRALAGDPAGTLAINLGARSAFMDLGWSEARYYGADYNRNETIALHSRGRHEYHLARTIYAADVVVSVPKMKTHKKVGVTLNLKGLVGTCTNKNCLIHYRLGTPSQGGDQVPEGCPSSDLGLIGIQRWLMDHALARQSRAGDACYRLARWAYRGLLKPFRSVSADTLLRDAGNWSGNDSAWRMTADLAKLFFFLKADGSFATAPARRMFCVVDGIIGGDGNGPLAPDPVLAGCLVAGGNPFAVDMVTARLMGFDVGKIRQFDLIGSPEWDFGFRATDAIEPVVNGRCVTAPEFFSREWVSPLPAFRPHPGWVGAIER